MPQSKCCKFQQRKDGNMKKLNNSSAKNINYRKESSTSIENCFSNNSSEYSQIDYQISDINTHQEYLVKNTVSKKVLKKDA